MIDVLFYIGVALVSAAAVSLILSAWHFLQWRAAVRCAETRVQNEARDRAIARLADELAKVHRAIRMLEQLIASTNVLANIVAEVRRRLDAIAPSAKEPSSG